MTGTTVSHYRVLSTLGTGGMSVVYLAEDLRLGRQVALKFLPPGLQAHPGALERLRREARLASALNHPYICTIHDIGEHEGYTFLVMERLEGTTLKRIIEQEGALALDRALRLGAQIADALSAAHAHGIVHRDVKPGNIFITPRDDVKLTDFGLAKQMPALAESDDSTVAPAIGDALALTSPGEALGTMSYMSPEQSRGEAVDARSDLFSLGSVLYEMVTGRRAFPGSAPAVIFDAILNLQPVPPQTYVPELPPALVAILNRTLAKDPADRYARGSDLRDDLDAVRSTLTTTGSWSAALRQQAPGGDATVGLGGPRTSSTTVPLLTPRPSSGPSGRTADDSPVSARPRRLVWLTSASGLISVLAVAGTWIWMPRPAPLTDRDSVMVGAFSNNTGDAVFDDTLREALIAQLDQSPFLAIVAAERMNETLRLMGRSPGDALTHDLAREACERMNAKAVIEGVISGLGEHFVLTLTATACSTGDRLAIQQSEVDRKEDVLRGLGAAARNLRARLGESLATVESFAVPIEQASTESLDALKAYTLGQARRAQGAEIESIPFFERAVSIDPRFATAWNALSLVYGNLGETVKGAEYGAKAYAERDHVSERERLEITYQYHDRVTGEVSEAIAALELWKRLYPRDYRPANSLSVTFTRIGNFERAAAEAREAIARSVDRGLAYSNLAYALRGLNQYDEARKVAEDAVSRGIETLPTRRLLYQLAVMRGDLEEADRHALYAEGGPRDFDLVGARAQVAAYEGRWNEARELYRRTIEMARTAGLREVAGGYAAQAAFTAALYEFPDEARDEARPLLALSPQVRLMAVTALALAGERGLAPRIEETLEQTPRDTLLVNVVAPIARAAVALAAHQPADAVDALRPTVPYDLGRTALLQSMFLRGEALRLANQPTEAIAEYTRVLEHRGTEPFASACVMARLGLARAHAAAGDAAPARAQYEDLLTLLKDADPDLPVLVHARSELARLTR